MLPTWVLCSRLCDKHTGCHMLGMCLAPPDIFRWSNGRLCAACTYSSNSMLE